MQNKAKKLSKDLKNLASSIEEPKPKAPEKKSVKVASDKFLDFIKFFSKE